MRGLRIASILVINMILQTSNAGSLLRFAKQTISTDRLQTTQSFDDQVRDYIIQFAEPISELDKQELEKLNFKIFRYIPDDALVVRGSGQALVSQRPTHNRVQAILPYRGSYKLAENVPALSVFSIGKKMNVLVSLFLADDASGVLSQINSYELLDRHGRFMTLRIEQSEVAKLVEIRGVEFVQKIEPMMTFNMPGESDALTQAAGDYSDINGYETGTKVIGTESLWKLGIKGMGQTVGVGDTGLDCGQVDCVSTDFKGAIRNGFYYGPGAKDWSDPNGHGTHVAGSVLGRGAISSGKLKGVAYEAQLVPQGMWSPLIDNLMVPKMGTLFSNAFDSGARVHSNSWGNPNSLGSYDTNAQLVDEYTWKNQDLLVVFAAGNSGVDKNEDGVIDLGSVSSPGTAKNALTVGASENLVSNGGIQAKIGELRSAKGKWSAEPIASSRLSDDVNGMAMFSSRGPTKDGRIKPEIVAPGTNVLSSRSHHKDAGALWGAYNNDYAWSGGTSMSTPIVSGAAALARQALIEKFKVDNPSAALLKATLLHTAFDMFPGQYGTGSAQELQVRPDMNQGYGRVDLNKLSELKKTVFIDYRTGVEQGKVFEKTVIVKEQGTLLVNLVYNDAPASPTSGVNLVNDLELLVVAPDGKVLSRNDDKNNHEIFEAKGLEAGEYKIQVKGFKVPMGMSGKQPFALAYTSI